MYLFRIDDISVNTDLQRLRNMICVIKRNAPHSHIMLAVSPLVHDLSSAPPADRQRAFPRILSAMSDHREFFRVKRGGCLQELADLEDDDTFFASHGLIHVDHRLLGHEAQELSILTSCSLLDTEVFVPPFNKYNATTIEICDDHGIELVKFEDGWQHVSHNVFSVRGKNKFYMHPFDMTPDELDRWFNVKAAA